MAEENTTNNVTLNLTATQAETIQDLLTNYAYAYRSDQEVDCKRELVQKNKVGIYPYVAEAPAAGLTNPTYDWVQNKWIDKTKESVLNRFTELDKKINELSQNQVDTEAKQQDVMENIKEIKQNSEAQTQILMQLSQKILNNAESEESND